MKNILQCTAAVLLLLIITAGISAQEKPEETADTVQVDTGSADSGKIDDVPTRGKLFFVFDEGVTASWLTRIIKQTGRSNFVFKDFLPGLYFGTDLHNMKFIVPTARIAAYYPMLSSFNDIPQKPANPLHFAVDFFAGNKFELDIFKYLSVNISPGLHLFFLNSDRWNYFNIGVAGYAGLEFPLAERWTILINGMASLDNGNLGNNRTIEPFDIVYQYQVDVGVRYSKKAKNQAGLFSLVANLF